MKVRFLIYGISLPCFELYTELLLLPAPYIGHASSHCLVLSFSVYDPHLC